MQPGPFVPPPVVSARQVRPSLWWFGVAGGLAVAGIASAIALWVVGITGLTDTIGDFDRIDVPGSGTVTIDDPGGYSIYHEYRGASGEGFSAGVSVTVTDPSGGEVSLRPYTSSVTYDFGGHEGEGLYTFQAERAGTYEVTTDGNPASVVAVGPGIGRGLVTTIVGGFVIGAIGVVGGGIVAIVTGVRRSRSRRMLTARMAAPGPPGPAGWPGAPGGWGAPPGTAWAPPPAAGGPQQPPQAPSPAWPTPPAPPGASAPPGPPAP